MLKKALITAGAALALVLAGAVVWVASDGDSSQRRVAALSEVEPLAEGVPGMLRWRGGFDCEAKYEALDVVVSEGSSYIARDGVSDCVRPPERPWDLLAAAGETGAQGVAGQQGVAGPPGTFNGTYSSPDGRFTLSVTNTGIKLSGPNMTFVEVKPTGVDVKAAATITVEAGGTATVRGAASVGVNGGLVNLGGTNCQPVARMNDQIGGSAVGGSPMLVNGRITGGSSKVFAC